MVRSIVITRLLLSALVFGGVWVLFSPAAYSEQIPSAGSVLREVQEPLPLPKQTTATIKVASETKSPLRKAPDLSIEVKGFRLSGLTVFSEQELQPVLEKYLGPNRRFDDLEAAGKAVTDFLRAAGYFLAQAYLPAQQIENGVVEIAVLEGRIGQVKVERESNVLVSESAVNSVLSMLEPLSLIHENNIERTLYLLGDLRGLQVQSVLQPGNEPGTADLVLALSPPCPTGALLEVVKRFTGCRLEVAVEADNFGSRYTGEVRVGGTVNWNNPLHRGDNLSVRALFSTDGGLSFGRAAYLIPVGPYGTKLGAAYSKLTYRLGTDAFKDLQARGSADVVSLFALHPLVRGRNLNLFGTLGYDHRRLEDKFDAIGLLNKRSLNAVIFTLGGDSRDRWLGGGINSFLASYSFGDLKIDTPEQQQIDAASIGRKTSGSFPKWNASFSRLQQITGPFLGFISVAGQMTSKSLDSSEKMSLGGPAAVRAYAEGEAASDQAVLFTAEVRFPVPMPERITLPGVLAGAVFFDIGYGEINKEPLPTDETNTRTLSGAGVGLTWGRPDDFLVRASVACRLSGRPISDPSDRFPRLFIQASKSF